jgi:hypothetical protein
MASVADILRKHGKWIRGEDLAKAVAKGQDVHKTTAFRRMRKDFEADEIDKITLPDRGTLYGLPNWPRPIPASQDKSSNEPRPRLLTLLLERSRGVLKNLLKKRKQRSTQRGLKHPFTPDEEVTLAYLRYRGEVDGVRFWKRFVDNEVWLSRGARPEEKPEN